MYYLLDTNTLSDLYNNNSSNHLEIIAHIQALKDDDDEIVVSVLTMYEMNYALQNAPEHKKIMIKQGIENILQNFTVIPLTLGYTETFGKIKKQFKDSRMISKENIKKHTLDIMLASCAITEKYTLVSADNIFPILNQLKNQLEIEDWT